MYVELGHDFRLSGLVLSRWFGTWPHAGRAGQHAGSLVWKSQNEHEAKKKSAGASGQISFQSESHAHGSPDLHGAVRRGMTRSLPLRGGSVAQTQ